MAPYFTYQRFRSGFELFLYYKNKIHVFPCEDQPVDVLGTRWSKIGCSLLWFSSFSVEADPSSCVGLCVQHKPVLMKGLAEWRRNKQARPMYDWLPIDFQRLSLYHPWLRYPICLHVVPQIPSEMENPDAVPCNSAVDPGHRDFSITAQMEWMPCTQQKSVSIIYPLTNVSCLWNWKINGRVFVVFL